MNKALERIKRKRPVLHKALYQPKRERMDWGLTDELAEWIDANTAPGCNVIETGSGVSSLVALGNNPASLVTIDPSPVTEERIRAYGKLVPVDFTPWRFVNMRSESALPKEVVHNRDAFDLAILDGSHTFPTPYIDWFYMSVLLKTGGVLFIDDVYTISVCKFLVEWLQRCGDEWQDLGRVGRAHTFRKLKTLDHPDRFMHDPQFDITFRKLKTLDHPDRFMHDPQFDISWRASIASEK